MQGIAVSSSCQHLSKWQGQFAFIVLCWKEEAVGRKAAAIREGVQTGQGSIKEDAFSIFYWYRDLILH